jgi:CheY-like chemotaxis protein
MTRQLLAFSRRQVLEPKVLDLNDVLGSVERLLRRMIGEDVQLTTGLKLDSAFVLADAGQIEQVLMNLAVNARDAMPDGGSLSISLGEAEVHRRPSLTPHSLAPGDYVTITVVDTGTGMSADTRAHLFEPFFTTKREAEGTGLGLATAYGIVKQSGGDIRVASEVGVGTTFTVFLPRLVGGPEAALVARAAPPSKPATETLLLVEDEPAVRRLTRRILEVRGYHVIEAKDGHEALAAARSHIGPIHLLLTDVVMPRMRGPDLVHRLSALRPETRVVFMSGYMDQSLLSNGGEEPPAFLQKPFTADALAAKLREVAGGPGVAVRGGERPVAGPAGR